MLAFKLCQSSFYDALHNKEALNSFQIALIYISENAHEQSMS